MQSAYDLVILMSVYNRYDKTLKTLSFFNEILHRSDLTYKIIVVDDKSTDKTSKLDSTCDIEIIRTAGDLFYTKSMNFGFDWIMLNIPNYKILMCINDDVQFNENILDFIIENLNSINLIAVGSCVDNYLSNKISYGFLISNFLNVASYKTLQETMPVKFSAFNFNCVLIKKEYLDLYGLFDDNFRHSKGDIDFSILAKKRKINIAGFSQPIGICQKIDGRITPYDSKLSIAARFKLLFDVKWHPIKETIYFHKKHNPCLWWITFMFPYFKWFLLLVKSIK